MNETILCKDVLVQQGSISREKVMQLESAINGLPEQINLDKHTHHHFAPGVYLRELFIPAGVVITGKIHRTKHLTIIASGTVRITTSNGVEEMTGPAVFVSDAGTKKAIYAITNSTIMNPLPTMETDIEKIEDAFIAPSFEALDNGLAIDDYQKFLIDTGLTEDDVQEMTHRPHKSMTHNGLEVLPSGIHGKGVFTRNQIEKGRTIALVIDGGEKTIAGRYCNHSGKPNAEAVVIDESTIKLVALRDIYDEEITTDYRNNIRIQEETL